MPSTIPPGALPLHACPHAVCLFTDTLGDINGVSRFIQNFARCARAAGRPLHILTSTHLPIPAADNIHNFRPLGAAPMPGYANLDIVLPPGPAMFRLARALRPRSIHISTPGPVGIVGRLAAARLGIPILGVYHTDFPAYIDHLFDHPSFTWLTRGFMRRFYRPFRAVFTRSDHYARSLRDLGIRADRLVRLLPGIDTEAFHPRFRDPAIWPGLAAVPRRESTLKLLYVGRISPEKNVAFLRDVWRHLEPRAPQIELVIVGDGPALPAMRRALPTAHFLGPRHGHQLSAIYASSDLFIFPSTTDTLGQVVMEAQASGLPVIVSDRGGPREVVGDGGIVLPADDPRRWADAILSLGADPERRQRMAAAAHLAMRPMSIARSFADFWRVHERLTHTRAKRDAEGAEQERRARRDGRVEGEESEE